MNRFGILVTPLLWFMALLLAAITAGCGSGGGGNSGVGARPADSARPTVISASPANLATDVAINRSITASFSEPMDAATITAPGTFTLTQNGTPVPADVSYADNVATLNPTSNLPGNVTYIATITTSARAMSGNALAVAKTWTFTTGTTIVTGPAPLNLGTAGNFAILSVSALTNTAPSVVTGDVGLSVASGTLIGLSCPEVAGRIYSKDVTAPPCKVTGAAMLIAAETDADNAYIDAIGRTPDVTGLGAGDIGGMTITPGVYKWTGGVAINTDVTLSGGPDDVWIFQIAQGLSVSSGVRIILAGGARPANVFWAPTWDVELGTNSQFKGILLPAAAVFMRNGASINGRLLAFAVHLDRNTVTQPAP